MYSSPWVFIDLETTGLKPETDQIIEFGLVRREGPDQRTDWQQLINPGRTLDPFIVSITGIDDAMLTDSPLLSSVREEAKAFLDEAVIVAHNAAFDVQFLEQQLQIQIDPRGIVDTIELAKILYPGLRSYSLRNLIKSFHIPVLPNHRAGDDARALEQLFVCLAAKADSLSPSLLRQIVEVLGDQEKGTGVFFTELLMDRRPAWLMHAIRDLSSVLRETAHAILPESESALSPQASPDDEEEESLFRSASVEKEEKKDKEIAQSFWQSGGMRKFLGQDGALARKIEHFQYRVQQTEMLEAVSRAFESARYLMIEAPTGVGKSLAYLIPAICWAKASDRRVVVATHTIALQEQLFQKEVALLKELLPFSFQCVMLKGRGNYLCLHRWQQVRERGNLLIWGERVLLAKLIVWQAEGGRGDMDSLHLFGMEREWFLQMTSSRETCQGNQCPLFKQCYFQKARAGANTAQLIIVNHALLLSGARLGEGVLPKHSYLVIDEAHHLEEDSIKQFTDIFSLMEFEKRLQLLHRRRDVFGRPGFLQYLKEYRQQGYAPLEKWNPYTEEMEKQLKAVMKRVDSLQASLLNSTLPETFRIKPGNARGSRLEGLLVSLDNLLIMADDLRKTLVRLGALMQDEGTALFEETWLKQQLLLFQEVRRDVDLLETFLLGVKEKGEEQGPDGECVYWVARDTRLKDISLCLTPLHIAACLQEYLFDGKESVVFTSATLSVNEGFDYCCQQLGIDREILDTKMLSSPFHHERQVLLLTDKDLPDPSKTSESAYNLALVRSLEILLEACGGRTMVLFTAHKQLRAMYDALSQPLRLKGLELFADGLNGNRTTLLEELRSNENAVIFGANTYWEGVDLPGLYLTSLLIVRLPFAPPGQPLAEARMEQLEAEGKDPFYHYSLPNAVLRFKQGYGRLIRTTEDWGVVVVLDNRIINKGYGRVFLQSLPDGSCQSASPKLLADKIMAWRKENHHG